MSGQSEMDIKNKFNEAFSRINADFEKANIDTALKIDNGSEMNILLFSIKAEQITSYPVMGKFIMDVEDDICTLMGEIMLSFNLNPSKKAEIRRVVNELNKQMVVGTVCCNPKDNSMIYRYKEIINYVDDKTVEGLTGEIAEKINKVVSMAAQILAIIEKNDYEADIDYDEDAENEYVHSLERIEKYLKVSEGEEE